VVDVAGVAFRMLWLIAMAHPLVLMMRMRPISCHEKLPPIAELGSQLDSKIYRFYIGLTQYEDLTGFRKRLQAIITPYSIDSHQK
jgi:hypothetical protein